MPKKSKQILPSREEILTERVKKLVSVSHITMDMIYDIVLSGHSVYRQGMGLSHEAVYEAINKGLEDQPLKWVVKKDK